MYIYIGSVPYKTNNFHALMKTQILILVHRINIDRHMIEFLSNEIEKFVNELSSNYLDLIMIDEDFYAKKTSQT